MTRLLVTAALLLPRLALAQMPDVEKVLIKVHPVSGAVYMLEGAGGNIGVSVGEDGIVVVDDEFAPLADKIRAALKGITDKPIRFILNTHWHFDHVGGNAVLGRGTTVVAHDNVRKRMASGGEPGNGGSLKMKVDPYPAAALPVLTFGEDVTVHLNGEDIRALHVPAGHTDGDAIIFFPKSKVVHMGDDFVEGFPFIDLGSGGSVRGLVQALEAVLPKIPPDAKVIPGHGHLSTVDDVKRFLAMVKVTTAVVEEAIADGKTLDQMKKERLLARWEQWAGPFVSVDLYTESLYNDLSGRKVGAFVPHN
jgi:glyoxylase-like metal-dependent hydrolase (beta-lactamase superfamily II)